MNTELLKQKAGLLEEYFCIHIDIRGNLSRLPVILEQYTPDMDRVPEFILCLGNDVRIKFYNNLFLYAFVFPLNTISGFWFMIIVLKCIVSTLER